MVTILWGVIELSTCHLDILLWRAIYYALVTIVDTCNVTAAREFQVVVHIMQHYQHERPTHGVFTKPIQQKAELAKLAH